MMLSLLIGKITGQVRTILVGQKLGFDSVYADGFSQGFLLTDFMFALLIGGSIQSAIVPYLSKNLEKDEAKAWRVLSNFICFVFAVMFFTLSLIYFFARPIMQYFTTPEALEATVVVAKNILPQALFMMLAGIFIGVLNSYRFFLASSLLPSFYNVLVCFSIYFFADQNLEALKWTALGISFSAFLYFVIQLWITRKKLPFFQPDLREWKETKNLFVVAFPTLIASALPQLATFIISSYYPLFPLGTAYAYSNAGSLGQLPFGVFALAIGNMFLPKLSSVLGRGEKEEAKDLIQDAFKRIFMTIVPSFLLSIVFRTEVVSAIFRWGGKMKEENIRFTADIMMFYSVLLFFLSVNYIINLIFYANGETKLSLFSSILNVVLLFVLCPVYVYVFQWGVASMAMAMASAQALQCLFLLIALKKKHPTLFPQATGRYLLRLCLVSVCIGIVAQGFNVLFPPNFEARKFEQLLQVALKGGVSFALFLVLSWFGKLLPTQSIQSV